MIWSTNKSITLEVDASYNMDDDRHESLDHLNARNASAMIPYAVILAIVSAIGVIGNTLVLLVFSITKHYKNKNFKIFATSLACIDLLTCATLIPWEIAKTRNYFSSTNPVPCKLKCFFTLFTQCSASFTLLVISVDRFRKVCQPLKKQIWPGLATQILILVAVLSFLIALPAPLLCGICKEVKLNTFNTNTTVYVCASENKYKTSLVRNLYKLCVSFIGIAVYLAFIIMYALITKKIVKHCCNTDSGQCIRFERDITSEPSNKVEVGRLTDKLVLPQRLETVVKYEPRTNPNKLASYSNNKRKAHGEHFGVHTCLNRSSPVSRKVPYKTIIWLTLTVIFIVTHIISAVLSFFTTVQYTLSPWQLVLYSFFFRIYFINNIVNPFIYVWLDTRFNSSCRKLLTSVKWKVSHCCTSQYSE